MVIICPECTTKFKINPGRIPAGGSKVRCARCKAVFSVTKEVEAAIPEQEVVAEPPLQTEQEETLNSSTEFSYERFQELDVQQEPEEFTFSGTDDITATGNTVPLKAEPDEDFRFAEAEPQDSTVAGASPRSEEPEMSQVINEAKIPEPKMAAQDQEENETEQLYQHLKEKKASPLSSIIRILLLLILAVLVAVGVFVYINGPDKLNDTLQQLLGQQATPPEPSGLITLANLQGKFLHNNHVGEVFLIRGEATNNFSQARSSIQVKGIIFDQSGQPLLQKTVFCGNPIADEEIAERPFEELEKMMGNQFGKNLSNMKVDAKQTIPFDIVFKDLPKNLSEFSVNVTASKPVSE